MLPEDEEESEEEEEWEEEPEEQTTKQRRKGKVGRNHTQPSLAPTAANPNQSPFTWFIQTANESHSAKSAQPGGY